MSVDELSWNHKFQRVLVQGLSFLIDQGDKRIGSIDILPTEKMKRTPLRRSMLEDEISNRPTSTSAEPATTLSVISEKSGTAVDSNADIWYSCVFEFRHPVFDHGHTMNFLSHLNALKWHIQYQNRCIDSSLNLFTENNVF